ncbi:putative GMP synthase [Daphnia magna]|uniref:Putative GMP synthase n=1 Tax=Daphnia magna TaxID=35525 RepID=A0A164QV91_9CRUS|nr:putative GMP synthase [Daphnia magna]
MDLKRILMEFWYKKVHVRWKGTKEFRILLLSHMLRVTTRRNCMTSISITVSCVKTNMNKSSLAYSNSGSIFGVAKARLTFYDASTNVNGRQTLSLCLTVNPEDKRRIIGDMFVKVIELLTI